MYVRFTFQLWPYAIQLDNSNDSSIAMKMMLKHVTLLIILTENMTWVFDVAAICVAGFSSDRNELLELHLPPKLFADTNKVTQ